MELKSLLQIAHFVYAILKLKKNLNWITRWASTEFEWKRVKVWNEKHVNESRRPESHKGERAAVEHEMFNRLIQLDKE